MISCFSCFKMGYQFVVRRRQQPEILAVLRKIDFFGKMFNPDPHRLYARDGKNSNSALMVQMKKEDFGGGLFDGIEFQRKIERRAYLAGGGYRAPVQLYKDFASYPPRKDTAL